MQTALRDLIDTFTDVLGTQKVLHGDRLKSRHSDYCHGAYDGGVLLRPETTEDVTAICKTADALGVALVAQGGLTGLVEATDTSRDEVGVSFEYLTRIKRLDPAQGVAVVEAGVTLESLINAAAEYGLQPGVNLPSRGSCTIGGMAGANAGGIQAIRYGMMRDNILGLTVVLASGEVLELNNTLVKNNAGYDLKHLFIGSEGTLGLITEIVVRLHPRPERSETAFFGCPDPAVLPDLLQMARRRFGSRLLSFEAMWPSYVDLTSASPGMGPRPLSADHALYGLVEMGSWAGDAPDATEMEGFLEAAFEAGLIADATVAQSEAQRDMFWRIREDSEAVEAQYKTALSYDIGLELADITPYVAALDLKISARFPGVHAFYYGHVGDGNLHIFLCWDGGEVRDRSQLDDVVYGTLSGFSNTTISAEHGIGLEKLDYLHLSRPPEALAAMQQLKAAFDPKGILNPGKVLGPRT